jgi:hypothetical protein
MTQNDYVFPLREDTCYSSPGLTKRELFAALAFHAMVSDPECGVPINELTETAIMYADQLLRDL